MGNPTNPIWWEDKPFRADELLKRRKSAGLPALQISGCCARLLLSRHLHSRIGYRDADGMPKPAPGPLEPLASSLNKLLKGCLLIRTKLLWEPVHTNFRVNADWRGSSPEVVFVGEVVGAEIGLIERLSCTS